MRLLLDGPLGDRVILTGIPQAYYRHTGEVLRVGSLTVEGREFHGLYRRNPFAVIDDDSPIVWAPGEDYAPRRHFEYPPEERWDHYRPRLVFHDMVGVWVEPAEVNPNLYLPRQPVCRRCVVSDEAGWESRRGYPYLDRLVQALRRDGWETVLMRNLCASPRQVVSAEHHAVFSRHGQAVALLRTAELFVGYESGLANVAGALGVPYVMFCGATPGASARHRSCIWFHDACPDPCCSPECRKCCLYSAPDVTEQALQAIRGSTRWLTSAT